MPKSDATLHQDVEIFDMVERYAGWLVVVGLVIELGHAFAFRQGRSFFEDWGPSIANLLVVVGVWLEILFAGRAKEASAELTRRSNDRLSLALERTEYRNLRDGKLLTALKQFPAATLVIKFLNDDPESHNFAMEFELVFSALGWKVSWYTESYGNALEPGIRLPDRNSEDASVIANIRSALTEAGIKFSTDPAPVPFQSIGPFGVRAAGEPLAILYLGPKPPVHSK